MGDLETSSVETLFDFDSPDSDTELPKTVGAANLGPIEIPKGINNVSFWQIVGAVSIAYEDEPFKQPTVETLMQISGLQKLTVVKTLSTDAFIEALRRRGVPWKLTDGLSAQQMYCLQILTDPTGGRDFTRKLKQAGISHAIYRAWLKQPLFARALNQMSENTIKESQSQVLTQLTRRATEGDIRAIELFNQMTGRWNPAQMEQMNVELVVGKIVEIITKHVTDPVILQKIATEFSLNRIGDTNANPNSVIRGELG
jgi:hypothetical protein